MARSVRRGSRLERATIIDVALAATELAIARVRLNSRHAQASIAASTGNATELDPCQTALVERVAFVIPRVAARLPWRADCLVQALAARRWLDRGGVATTLTFGVPRNKPAEFEAHAWLSVGAEIVTGGDISGYVPLSPPS